MAAPDHPAATRLRLEKTLPAPPRRVFGAFTDPEQLRQWWGPIGFTVASLHFDVAEGEDYRITMQPVEGDVFHISGSFRVVEEPRRLGFTFSYEEPDPDDQVTLVMLTLDPSDAGTRLVLEQEPFKTAARRELHRDGWRDTLERLEQSLM